MGESSHVYHPELLLQNGRTSDKFSRAALSMGREKAVSGDVARFNQREVWNQSAGYRANLGLSNADMNKYGPSNPAVREYVPRTWETDRREGSRQNTSNPIDMSLPRSQHLFSPHTVHNSEQQPTLQTASSSRNSRSYMNSPASSCLSRGSPFSNSNKSTPHRSSRNSDASALLEAVQKRDQAEIARLLQSGVDVNAMEAGLTALHQAAKNGDVEMMEYLLMRGAKMVLRDQYGRTPDFYSMKHNISVGKLFHELRLASQRSGNVHPAPVDWRQSYTKDPPASTLQGNFADRRSSDHGSSDHRQPDRRQLDHRQPDHRQLDHRQPDHLQVDYQPPDHSQLDHRHAEYRQPEHRQHEHRQPRSVIKQRYHQSSPSPAHHDANLLPHGKSDKRDERYNHADSHKASRYDRFPKPFDHMLRPPQSDSMPAGLEPPVQTVEHNLSASNRPKSYRIPEPTSTAKYPPEHSSIRPEHRQSFPVIQKQPGTEKQMLSELKKPSFLIDELTKSAQIPRSGGDKNGGLNYLKQSAITDRHDPSAVMLRVDPSRLPSQLPADIYGLSATNALEAQSRLAAHPHSLYYYPPDVAFPVPPVLYHPPYINPSSLPLPAHGGQVNPTQQPATLLQPLGSTPNHLGSGEHSVAPRNVENFPPKISEHAQKAVERRSPSVKHHDNQLRKRSGSKDISAEDRPDYKEATLHRLGNQTSNLSSSSKVAHGTSCETAVNLLSPLPNSYQHKETEPPSSSSDIYHKFKSSSKEDGLKHTGTRRAVNQEKSKIVNQESRDTDMRPFLYPHTAAITKTTAETPSRGVEKTIVYKPDNTSSMPKKNTDLPSSVYQSVSFQKRDISEAENVASKPNHSPKHSVKPLQRSSSKEFSDKNKAENVPKRKYTKVTAPIAKLDKQTVEKVENKERKDEGDNKEKKDKLEPKPKGKKGRKRKHFPDASDESKVTANTTAKEIKRDSSVENDGMGKREKRRKKSEPEDEYVYEWMYDDFSSEPENDDSEDEDFQCPYQKQAAAAKRGRKRTMPKRSPRHCRQSSQRIRATFFEGDTSGDEQPTDEEGAPEKPERIVEKPKPKKRGPKPGSRATRTTPRKYKKVRKLSSDSTESEGSYDDAPRTAKFNKTKKRARLISSDKEEKMEPEKPVVKRGRGRRRLSDKKGFLQSKRDAIEEKPITPIDSEGKLFRPTKNTKSALKYSAKQSEEEESKQKPDVIEVKRKGKTRRSVSEVKARREFPVDLPKETALVDEAIRETKLTGTTQEPDYTIDLTNESKAIRAKLKETILASDIDAQEEQLLNTANKMKRPSKPAILGKPERKLKDLKKGSILDFEEKRKNQLTYGAKRANALNAKRANAAVTMTREKGPGAKREVTNDTKSLNLSMHSEPNADDSKRELADIPKEENISDAKSEAAKREKTVKVVKREGRDSVDEQQETKFSSDFKRETKIAKNMKPAKTTDSPRKYNLKKENELKLSSKISPGKENTKGLPKARITTAPPRHATEKDLSHSLIELYTGKHISPLNSTSDDTSPIEPVAEKTKDVNLFGDDLTESETQVLFNHSLLGTDVIDAAPETNSSIKPSFPDVDNTFVSLSRSSLSKPTKEPGKAPQGVKIPAKKGRKPKALLQAQQDTSASPMKKQKLDVKIAQTKLHQKYTYNKATNIKPNDVLPRPRKGRPPGSKNKLKKFQVNKILKKPGRKPLIKCAIQLPGKNSSLSVSSASLDLPRTPSTSHSRSRTPVFGRPGDKDRGVDSPGSSVLSASIVGKSLTPSAISSRSSTPLGLVKNRRTANLAILPPNVKKLTCNNAIGETVLHKAARHGYMDNILHYLENGMEVNTKDNAGYTALHEACVKGRVAAARLLLEFGADVNINSEDGTRPIHDAVEHNHVEITRLLLTCGADPMLSKFSGRAIRDMIHSTVMKSFLTSYLADLKPREKEKANEESHWNVSASVVLDESTEGCDVLANPPDEDSDCEQMEFELLEEEPFDTYLIQPTESIGRSNFFILSELLRSENCSRGEFLLQHPADVKVGDAEKLQDEAETNWVPNKQIRIAENSKQLIELVPAESFRRNCRVFKVDGRGNVTSISSTSKRLKNSAFYPHGAFCEQRTYALPEVPPIASETSLENANIPSCSRSPSQSYEHLSASSSDSEAAMSGVTALTTTADDGKEKSLESKCQITNSDLFDNSTQNGVIEKPILFNGFSCQDNVENSPSFMSEETKQENSEYNFESLDIARYSPTSDLRPPVVNDNDPTRTLTETENAVLNLTFGAGLSSIHVPCGLPQPDTALPFVNHVTKSPNPAKNHVKEFD